MKKCLLTLLFLFASVSIFAEINFDLNGDLALVVGGDKKDVQLEDYVRFRLLVDVDGYFEIISVAQSGDDFTEDTNVIKSTDSKAKERQRFHLRNLYIEKRMDFGAIQFGALEITEYLAMATAKNPNGWIDGGRLTLELGDITFASITGGRINPDEASIFSRDDYDGMSFVEIQVCTSFFENIMVNLGIEKLDDDVLFKGVAQYDLKLISENVLSLIAEAMVRAEDGEGKYSVGFIVDVVRLFTGRDSGSFLYGNYVYTTTDDLIIDRLIDPAYTGKSSYVLGLKGTVCKKNKLGWYSQLSFHPENDEYKFETGVTWYFDLFSK